MNPRPDAMQRRQRRRMDAAQAVLGPETPVVGYAFGVGKLRVPSWVVALGVLLVVAAIVAISETTGQLVVPGIIPILIGVAALRPRFGIVLTPGGTFLMKASAWTGLPRSVREVVPTAGALQPVEQHQRLVRLQVGRELLFVRQREFQQLLGAAATMRYDGTTPSGWQAVPSYAGGPPAGWYPAPDDPSRLAFWDGYRWLAAPPPSP